jgi:predicted Zn-dependent protease
MTTWKRYPESDASPAARYARAIAQYRSGRTDQAIALLAPMLREQPGNPWLRELQGQILFEAGRPREAVAPLREAARLAPSEALIRTALGRALMEAGDPAMLGAAAAEFEASLRLERDNGFTWRQLGIVQGRRGLGPQADLALAEEAMLDGDFPKARRLARQAEEALPPSPLKVRAQDLREAARRDNLTKEQREQDDAMRRRQPR